MIGHCTTRACRWPPPFGVDRLQSSWQNPSKQIVSNAIMTNKFKLVTVELEKSPQCVFACAGLLCFMFDLDQRSTTHNRTCSPDFCMRILIESSCHNCFPTMQIAFMSSSYQVTFLPILNIQHVTAVIAIGPLAKKQTLVHLNLRYFKFESI